MTCRCCAWQAMAEGVALITQGRQLLRQSGAHLAVSTRRVAACLDIDLSIVLHGLGRAPPSCDICFHWQHENVLFLSASPSARRVFIYSARFDPVFSPVGLCCRRPDLRIEVNATIPRTCLGEDLSLAFRVVIMAWRPAPWSSRRVQCTARAQARSGPSRRSNPAVPLPACRCLHRSSCSQLLVVQMISRSVELAGRQWPSPRPTSDTAKRCRLLIAHHCLHVCHAV